MTRGQPWVKTDKGWERYSQLFASDWSQWHEVSAAWIQTDNGAVQYWPYYDSPLWFESLDNQPFGVGEYPTGVDICYAVGNVTIFHTWGNANRRYGWYVVHGDGSISKLGAPPVPYSWEQLRAIEWTGDRYVLVDGTFLYTSKDLSAWTKHKVNGGLSLSGALASTLPNGEYLFTAGTVVYKTSDFSNFTRATCIANIDSYAQPIQYSPSGLFLWIEISFVADLRIFTLCTTSNGADRTPLAQWNEYSYVCVTAHGLAVISYHSIRVTDDFTTWRDITPSWALGSGSYAVSNGKYLFIPVISKPQQLTWAAWDGSSWQLLKHGLQPRTDLFLRTTPLAAPVVSRTADNRMAVLYVNDAPVAPSSRTLEE